MVENHFSRLFAAGKAGLSLRSDLCGCRDAQDEDDVRVAPQVLCGIDRSKRPIATIAFDLFLYRLEVDDHTGFDEGVSGRSKAINRLGPRTLW